MQITFLDEKIAITDLPGEHSMHKTSTSTDMSGRFKLSVRIRYQNGEMLQHEMNMRRPKGRPVLQMAISDEGALSFR